MIKPIPIPAEPRPQANPNDLEDHVLVITARRELTRYSRLPSKRGEPYPVIDCDVFDVTTGLDGGRRVYLSGHAIEPILRDLINVPVVARLVRTSRPECLPVSVPHWHLDPPTEDEYNGACRAFGVREILS